MFASITPMAQSTNSDSADWATFAPPSADAATPASFWILFRNRSILTSRAVP